MTVIAWANGKFIDPTTPVVAPSAYGLTIGQGLFETCAVYSGRIFALDLHLNRLAQSAAALGLGSVDLENLTAGCTAVARKLTDTAVARLRVTVTGGAAELGVLSTPRTTDVTILAGAAPGPALGELNQSKAIARTSSWLLNERSATAGHKVTSYLDNALALREASENGATEALLFNTRGDVSEGATSNIIFDLDGQLLTPALSSGCLPGITRALALTWAAEAGLEVLEALPGQLTAQRIKHAPAALLGTLRNVQEVGRLDADDLPGSQGIGDLQRIFATNMTGSDLLS